MKSYSKKTLFWCLAITLIKIFPDPNLKFDINNYIFPLLLITSLSLIYFIPKKFVGVILAVVTTTGMALYNTEYFVYTLPIVFLFSSHTYAVSQYETIKKTKKTAPLSIVFSTLALLSLIPQFLYAQETKTNIDNTDSLGDLAFEVCYIAIFIILFIVSVRYKGTYNKKIPKETVLNFKLLYFSVVVCICACVYNIIIGATSKTITHATELNYWFIFLVMFILNKDPYLDILKEKFHSESSEKTKKVKK